MFPLCPTRVAREAKQPAQAPGLSGTAPVAAGSSAPEVATSGCEAGSSTLPHEAPGARPIGTRTWAPGLRTKPQV